MASSTASSPARRSASPLAQSTARAVSPASSTDASSDEDVAILRPRGKLAARMLGQTNSPPRLPAQEVDDARERVRRMLGLAPEPEDVQNEKSSSAIMSGGAADEEDDEDQVIVSRPRKLQQRRQRSVTPEADEAKPIASQTPTPKVSRVASRSPGLFVSSPVQPRSPSTHSQADNSDSDAEFPSIKNTGRFKEILARKRAERLAREAEEQRKRAARLERQQAQADLMQDSEDDSAVTDDDGGRALTQRTRAPRKASKKALEEMSRETQRMTRSLQLAHEAKTRRKITKASLFERFNFKPEGSGTSESKLPGSSRPSSPVTAQHTDAEMKEDDTPPSSPPAPAKPADGEKIASAEANTDSLILGDGEDEFPSMEATFEAATRKTALDKGKGKATEADLEEQAKEEQAKAQPKIRRNVRVKLPVVHANTVSLGSDDELDIQKPSKIDTILSRVPINKAKESRPMYILRQLAQVDDPEKKGTAPVGIGKRATKPSMTAAEFEQSLLQRARQQAKLERDRRLEFLKSKGVHIPTEEERERERAEVEDIVARAREEAEEIMLREREAEKKARKERKEAGEVDPLAWDDSDASDDDYEEEKGVEVKEIELSGSEEEDEEMEDEDEEESGSPKGGLIDDAAESDAESEEEEEEAGDATPAGNDSDDDNAAVLPRQASRRSKKQVVILSDDDESDHHVEATPKPKAAYPKSPSAPNTASPKVPTSVLRSATKTFIPGLPVPLAGPAGLGLTQIFAGTMDDSQAGPLGASPSQPMPTFDNFPDSQFSQTAQEAGDDMVLDSQPTQQTQAAGVETQEGVIQLHFSQSQVHGFDTLLRETDGNTQQTDMLEPTQDAGFQEYTPLKQRFIEPPASTVDTVVLSESQRIDALQGESTPVHRTGKLRRRADVLAAARAAAESESESEDQEMDGVEYDEFGFGTTSAFAVMKDAAAREKKLKEKAAFDKKKSKAREMVDEQADESEDEYAGLGGADGEDSDDESTASVQEMMDDDTKLSEADRAKLKAFYADRERASDEKQVEKLFKDITTGMLRRKRGAGDYDLSDSDDGGEAKRRMKRRQFAKMQKALFADERVSKVAENPRTQAFLRTIEDRGSDDEMDFLFAPGPTTQQTGTDSQEESQQGDSTVPDSQPQVQPKARASGPQRRTRDGRKPTTLGDIRASLSDLLEESVSVIPSTDPQSSDRSADEADADEDDAEEAASAETDKENRNPRRTSGAVVVDRISLKRNSSSVLSVASDSSTRSAGGRLAFANPTISASSGGFKVPALLRRATTNSSILSTGPSNTASFSTTAGGVAAGGGGSGGFGEDAKIRRNAGKKSGINYFARENERRAAVAESEKRREARKWKGAEGRGKVVGSLFGSGKFE